MTPMARWDVNIRWGICDVQGSVEIVRGRLERLAVMTGTGRADGNRFHVRGDEPGLRVSVTDAACAQGAYATAVTVWTGDRSFSFFLRDVLPGECPIFIPEFDVAVVCGDDSRAYAEIEAAVAARGLVSDFDRFRNTPEESYAKAASKNRTMPCPTWLGVPRDARFFRVAPRAGTLVAQIPHQEGFWGVIERAVHSVRLPTLTFALGRGDACRFDISRRLLDGVLPVLQSRQREETMIYDVTMFATLENDPALARKWPGTDWRIAYAHAGGNMLPDDQRDALCSGYAPDNELVLCCRVHACNPGQTPNYAWFKAPHLAGRSYGYRSTCSRGLVRDSPEAEGVTAVARLDGRPAPQAELAVLVQPGECVVYEFIVPHREVSEERGRALLSFDVDACLTGVASCWRQRLRSASRFLIPEAPIREHVEAGLLHLDLAAVGAEPDGPVAATIGWYAPIGTESAPIIQMFDLVGWHALAERSIDFFLQRQRADGFIQNFAGYESETGPLLWTVGQHFRYTRDLDWLTRIAPNIRNACEYLLAWRRRNMTDENRAAGTYGLVSGKVADPDDFYHQFFLNAGTYIGLARAAEIMVHVDPAFANQLQQEADAFRRDIRDAFYAALAKAPVVPLADGTWAPLPPPWPDQRSATTLYGEGGNWFTHGTFAARSVLTGAMWLAFWEVLDPRELGSTLLLKVNQAPATCDNAALSQPYYSRHDAVHLARGEIKEFLRAYYNQLTALADRETRTFWEHYSGHSQHKTHEEAWFLMQTRWALCREAGDTLCLFPGTPRAWLAPGARVGIEHAVTAWGVISFAAQTDADGRTVTVVIRAHETRRPERLSVRVPHPECRRATDYAGPGHYDPHTETVTIDTFDGQAQLRLTFP
jgi:hypothetical protein